MEDRKLTQEEKIVFNKITSTMEEVKNLAIQPKIPGVMSTLFKVQYELYRYMLETDPKEVLVLFAEIVTMIEKRTKSKDDALMILKIIIQAQKKQLKIK